MCQIGESRVFSMIARIGAGSSAGPGFGRVCHGLRNVSGIGHRRIHAKMLTCLAVTPNRHCCGMMRVGGGIAQKGWQVRKKWLRNAVTWCSTTAFPSASAAHRNGACSSAGEHYVDIVGVTGSIPVTPTISPIRKMHEYSGIWCIRSGGTDLERMTSGTSVDWVPHPSPGGKTILYLSCVAGSEGHPRNPHADLGLLHLKDG